MSVGRRRIGYLDRDTSRIMQAPYENKEIQIGPLRETTVHGFLS